VSHFLRRSDNVILLRSLRLAAAVRRPAS